MTTAPFSEPGGWSPAVWPAVWTRATNRLGKQRVTNGCTRPVRAKVSISSPAKGSGAVVAEGSSSPPKLETGTDEWRAVKPHARIR